MVLCPAADRTSDEALTTRERVINRSNNDPTLNNNEHSLVASQIIFNLSP